MDALSYMFWGLIIAFFISLTLTVVKLVGILNLAWVWILSPLWIVCCLYTLASLIFIICFAYFGTH
jgi:hypothetical protein